MRDPLGTVSFEGEFVVRRVHEPLAPGDFLRSDLARKFVERGQLVDFEIVDPRRVVAPRLPFVSLPEEWCDLQAFNAAQLTLEMQSEAIAHGYDMKDASAWNILFDGAKPIFCDLLSFELLTRRRWSAAGQLSRHFLLPLLLAKRRRFHFGRSFRVWRDGVPSDAARAMLGPSRFFSRYWPLMADDWKAHSDRHAEIDLPQVEDAAMLRRHRESLQVSLGWMLGGLRPALDARNTVWADYETERLHYGDETLATKRQYVDEWLGRVKPGWVVDLGCNAGEFSFLARDRGAKVLAIDSDHDAVQRLYQRLDGGRGIQAVVAPLDDLSAGRGWAGSEYRGLAGRLEGQFDLVMMLALIHHLMVAASIPVGEIARFMHRCGMKWLIVEWIGSEDSQLRKLCERQQRLPTEFDMSIQRRAFVDAGFLIQSEVALPAAHRSLALLRRV